MIYTWLLFDLDNTLFDYDMAEASALRRAFEGAGIEFREEYAGIYQQINHRAWQDYEKGMLTAERLNYVRFERLLHEIDSIASPIDFSENYRQYLSEGNFLIGGAERLVRQLQPHYRLAAITNGLSKVQRPRLAASPFADTFDVLIISDEVGVAKPDAGIFNLVFASMCHPPKSEVLIIGDSLTSDMAGGISYGIDTCWYNPHQKPHPDHITPTYQIQQLSDLLTILC
jgi:2-haloacid dehalogenase